MKTKRLSKISEFVLWITGGVCISVFLAHLALAEIQRTSGISEFRQQQEASGSSRLSGNLNPDKSLWSEGRIAAFTASLLEPAGDVIGIFELPRLKLEVPVYDGASELHMDRGVALIEGTAGPGKPGNMGIAGHRDGYFRVLKDIAIGDEITISTETGNLNYRVEKTMIVEPTAVEVLDRTSRTAITLVTCYPFYFVGHAPQRFIVRAILQEEEALGANNDN